MPPASPAARFPQVDFLGVLLPHRLMPAYMANLNAGPI